MNSNSKQILVVDDEPAMRAMAKAMLEKMGYDVVLANSGEQAIDLYHQSLLDGEEIAMAIMDLTLPGGMSGVEALQELRQMEGELPIVATSGYLEDNAYDICQQIGFVGVLPKPFTAEKLRTLVTWVVSRRGVPGGYDEGPPKFEDEKTAGEEEREKAVTEVSPELPHSPQPQVNLNELPTSEASPKPVGLSAPSTEVEPEPEVTPQPMAEYAPEVAVETEAPIPVQPVPQTGLLEETQEFVEPETAAMYEPAQEEPAFTPEFESVQEEPEAVVVHEPVHEEPEPAAVYEPVLEEPEAVESMAEIAPQPIDEAELTGGQSQPATGELSEIPLEQHQPAQPYEPVAESEYEELPVEHLHQTPKVSAESENLEVEEQEVPEEQIPDRVGGIADRLSDLVDFAVSNRKA